MSLNLPTEVYSWKTTLVTAGKTFTIEKVNMNDKAFAVSCFDKNSPALGWYTPITDEQYVEKMITLGIKLKKPPLPLPFQAYVSSIFKVDGVSAGWVSGRWTRREDEEDGKMVQDEVFTYMHKDFRGKNYFKYMLALGQYNTYVYNSGSKTHSSILDSEAGPKVLNARINAVYEKTEPTSVYGDMHKIETNGVEWKKYTDAQGWEFTIEEENIPIADAKWATTEINIELGTRSWNTV